jgi:hypothetical protein
VKGTYVPLSHDAGPPLERGIASLAAHAEHIKGLGGLTLSSRAPS